MNNFVVAESKSIRTKNKIDAMILQSINHELRFRETIIYMKLKSRSKTVQSEHEKLSIILKLFNELILNMNM